MGIFVFPSTPLENYLCSALVPQVSAVLWTLTWGSHINQEWVSCHRPVFGPLISYLPSLLCSDLDGCWWLGFSPELLCAGGGGAGLD